MKKIIIVIMLLISVNVALAVETPTKEVPYLITEKSFEPSCGIDVNEDGYRCDLNEDWLSCPEDCDFPSLDNVICQNTSRCVWEESWFLKLAFAGLLAATIYLLYTDLTMPPRLRKIFRR